MRPSQCAARMSVDFCCVFFLLLAAICSLTASDASVAPNYPKMFRIKEPLLTPNSFIIPRANKISKKTDQFIEESKNSRNFPSFKIIKQRKFSPLHYDDNFKRDVIYNYFYSHNATIAGLQNEIFFQVEEDISMNPTPPAAGNRIFESQSPNFFSLKYGDEISHRDKEELPSGTQALQNNNIFGPLDPNSSSQDDATEEDKLGSDGVENLPDIVRGRIKRQLPPSQSASPDAFGSEVTPSFEAVESVTNGFTAGNVSYDLLGTENEPERGTNSTDDAERREQENVSKGNYTGREKSDDSLRSDREQLKVLLARLELDCRRKMLTDPAPKTGCGRVWDQALCWEPTLPNTTSLQPCPVYIIGMENEKGFAFKRCDADGNWARKPPTFPSASSEKESTSNVLDNSSNNITSSHNMNLQDGQNNISVIDDRKNKSDIRPSEASLYSNHVGWTDYTQCLRVSEDDEDDLSLMMEWLPFVKRTSLIGYSISLITLTISFIILASLKKLRCPRNLLHLHLFASFILRAAVVLLRSSVLASSLITPAPALATQPALLKGSDTWWCRLMITIWQYFITANYSWILMEGLYLHNLIFRALFTDSSAITLYILLGWGLPLLLVGSWASVRAAVDDSHCWMLHKKPWIFMALIRIPVAFSVFLNFFFFINIVRVLTMKLRSSVSDENMKYRKLAKSTLVLVPLFGVHYCLLWGLSTSRHPTVELAWLVMDQVFASFQGFFVAVLYCLMNGEVRQEMKKIYYNKFGGGDRTLFNAGQSTMISHTRVYTSWWAKIRSRLMLCCRATRTSIHSLHSMTERRDRQSPSPKMPKKSSEPPYGNCVPTGGNNHCGNGCGVDCSNDCQKCGEEATLVRQTCCSLLPTQTHVQEHGVEELIELQERNHVSSPVSPAYSSQMVGQNTSGPRPEGRCEPSSGAQNLLEAQISASGDGSLMGPENELLCLIPNQCGSNYDGNPKDAEALRSADDFNQKCSPLKKHSNISSSSQNNFVQTRPNFIDRKDSNEFNGSNREQKLLDAWAVGENKDETDSGFPRSSKALVQDLNPAIDPIANLENGRRELSDEPKSSGVNSSEIFDNGQLEDKALPPEKALRDIQVFESDSVKKKERPSKVKYCGESKVATTVIALEDENKEGKDETML